ARRVWGTTATRRARHDADVYCRERGQYGLASAGGQLAYGRTMMATQLCRMRQHMCFTRAFRTMGRNALNKWVAVGPRSAELVVGGRAARVEEYGVVCGVPIGDRMAALAAWRKGYEIRLVRIRELAGVDVGLAASAAMALRGPGALAAFTPS